MKEVFLIGCHIQNELQLSYLSELVSKLKSEDKDYIIVSHTQVPDFITKGSIAYLYDSDNHLIENHDLGVVNRFWYSNESFQIGSPTLFYGSIKNYSVAAQNLLNRGLLLSRSFEYDITHWIEYDFDWSPALTNDNIDIIRRSPDIGLVTWWCKNNSQHSKDTVFDHIFGSLITINNHLLNLDTLNRKKSEIIFELKKINFICEIYTEKYITTGQVYKKDITDYEIKNRYSSQNNYGFQWAIFHNGSNLNIFLVNTSDKKIDINISSDDESQIISLWCWSFWSITEIGNPKHLTINSGKVSHSLDLTDDRIYNYYVKETVFEDF